MGLIAADLLLYPLMLQRCLLYAVSLHLLNPRSTRHHISRDLEMLWSRCGGVVPFSLPSQRNMTFPCGVRSCVHTSK